MRTVIGICLCMIFLQCKDATEVTDEMVNKKLAELRQNFIKEKTLECDKMLMKEIEEKADSILIYLSKRNKYDSLTIPYDSIRPEKPEVIFPEYRKPEKPEEKINLDSNQNLEILKPK